MKIRSLVKEGIGIAHIEHLPIYQFIDAIRNLNEFDISEKVDGFNIKFGLDDQGFYTRGKGPDRIRQASEYGKQFRYIGFKSAHKALGKALQWMLKSNAFSKGDEIEAEVLFGEMPNTVPYNNDSNKIILLRATEGQPNLDVLKEFLENKVAYVNMVTPYTEDGSTIKRKKRKHKWTFSQTPKVSKLRVLNVLKDKKIEMELKKLEKFLLKKSGIYSFDNAELLALPLNRRPSIVPKGKWRELVREVKEKKEEIEEHIMGFKLEIKETLLNELVRTLQSGFGPEIKDGGWIEGVVLRRENDDGTELIKIVDKDVFTALNNFNWQVRRTLTNNPVGTQKVSSFIGKVKVTLGKIMGHPELGTVRKKKYIEKNNLTSKEIAKEIDFKKAKTQMLRSLDRFEDMLSRYHDLYNKSKESIYKDIDFGEFRRRFKIDPVLDRKNLEAFSELYELLTILDDKISLATTAEELAEIVIGDPYKENELKKNDYSFKYAGGIE